MKADWSGRADKNIGAVLLDAPAIRKRVHELGDQITGDYRGRNPHLIAILKGACIFHADLVRAIDLNLSMDFIAVRSYGNATRTSGEVRLLKDLDESVEGRDVLLVEDILDTGLTAQCILQNLGSRGPRSLKVVTLLNKPSHRQVDVPVDYVGFEIPDYFVVGYGLDFKQRYRNLPEIRILSFEAPGG